MRRRLLKCTCSQQRQASTVTNVGETSKLPIQPPSKNIAIVHPDQLQRAYSLYGTPSIAAYAALSSRIPALSAVVRSDLKLIEQCCICPSFWIEHRLASTTWLKSWKTPTSSLTHFCDDGQLDNSALAMLVMNCLVPLRWSG